MDSEFKVIFGPQSRRDLQHIVRYIAQAAESASIAQRFGRMLIERALSLASLPERGRIVPELGHSSVREIIFRNYRIVYRIAPGNVVQILRFWHAARGTPEITIEDFTGSNGEESGR